jgi:excisionase family DNA binding protein
MALHHDADTEQTHGTASFSILDEGDDNDLLTVREVARICRVDDTTVRRWIKGGALEAVALPHSGRRQAYRVKRGVLRRALAPQLSEDSTR